MNYWLRYWVRHVLATHKVRSVGLWYRRHWEMTHCFECGTSEPTSYLRPTRFGRWQQEYRSFCRLGLTRYLERRKQDEQMREMMRDTVRMWNRSTVEGLLKPSPLERMVREKT